MKGAKIMGMQTLMVLAALKLVEKLWRSGSSRPRPAPPEQRQSLRERHGGALLMQLLQQLHDNCGVFGIEIAGGFVREDDRCLLAVIDPP